MRLHQLWILAATAAGCSLVGGLDDLKGGAADAAAGSGGHDAGAGAGGAAGAAGAGGATCKPESGCLGCASCADYCACSMPFAVDACIASECDAGLDAAAGTEAGADSPPDAPVDSAAGTCDDTSLVGADCGDLNPNSGCEACLVQSCCAELSACLAVESCARFYACYRAHCSTLASANCGFTECQQCFGGAFTQLSDLSTCGANKCADC